MTTFYIRPTSGNDSAAGTSPATAWQSLTLGALAALIAPGDELRVEESGAATSAGNATWTDGSGLVAKAAASNATVSVCDTAWTAVGAGVATTTSATRKLGALASSFTLPASLPAGRVAFAALGATDFSAYRQICFWVRADRVIPAGTLRINLCSDALGAAVVNVATVAYAIGAGVWTPIVVNTGAALGASIQSVMLSTLLPLSASSATILIDNIFVAKAVGSADEITLRSLISKSGTGEAWFPIRSVDGTSIALDAGINDGPTALSPLYAGSTALVATWVKQALALPAAFTLSANGTSTATDCPWGLLNDSGTAVLPLLITGGWDSAAMLAQTSETILDLVTGFGTGMSLNSQSDVHVSKLSFCHSRQGFEVTGMHNELDGCSATCLGTGAAFAVGLVNYARDTRIRHAQAVGGSMPLVTVDSGPGVFEDLLVSSCSHATMQAIISTVFGTAEFNGLRVYDAFGALLTSAPALVRGGENRRLRNTVDFNVDGYIPSIELTICDFLFANGTEVAVSGALTSLEWRVNLQNRNLVPNDHLVTMEGGTIVPDTAFFQSGDKSWLFSPSAGYRTSARPMVLPLGPLWKLLSPPAAAQSVSVWVYRDSANIQARLRIPAGQLCSMSGDLTAVDAGGVGSWNQITIPITMTADGVIDAQLEVYTTNGLAGYHCWTDDLS